MAKVLYTARAHVVGGRDGHGGTDDGALEVDLRRPQELGGDGGGTNPEQLFAIGYAACFESALAVVAVSLPGLGDREIAAGLVRDAHQVCPYSNATRGNIEVDLLLQGAPV
jgi:lipoyl-dependent peroxiredoxin